MKLKLYLAPLFLVLAVGFVLHGCSSTSDYKGVYEAEQDEGGLEVPPGLDEPQTRTDLALPEQRQAVRTYSGYSEAVLNKPGDNLIETYDNVRFVREGSLYWLRVDAPPQQVWQDVRNFFRKVGFEIENEYPKLGMMETNWKENLVDVPANWLGSLFSTLYTAELRDKYRIRLEYTEDKQKTRVFIAHQGMKQVEVAQQNASPGDPVQTGWVPRESDEALEVEMLMRFMAYLGLSEEQARERIAQRAEQPQRTELKAGAQRTVLQVHEPFHRAWRHVGLALDRLGFYVEDQNREAGVYYIRLPEHFKIAQEEGWFSGLFGSEKATPMNTEYMLVVKKNGGTSSVTLRSREDMAPAQLNKVAEAVLKRIQQNIL